MKEEKPVFLAGDMNALPDSPVMKDLQKQFVPLSNFKDNTYPADQPNKCIDYILGYIGNGQKYTV